MKLSGDRIPQGGLTVIKWYFLSEGSLHCNISLLIVLGNLKKRNTFLCLWLSLLVLIKESRLCFMMPKPTAQSSQYGNRTTTNRMIWHYIDKTANCLTEIFTCKSVILTSYGHNPSKYLNGNLKIINWNHICWLSHIYRDFSHLTDGFASSPS